ncbi:holin family protein [Endozoicomonas sp. YOMI1]|uniref:holin family protein n=1 Tax=Endozoicomonas sp. YOMI1 TaxID=2828739 RepID=UPI002149712D|nr:holin family protein [Endozoicomonas sp. YOMI1]
MSWLATLFGKTAAEPIKAVGNVIDGLFTSDEERLDKQAVLERIRQQPALVQAEINKVEAGHRSVFVAGWRPFIGWVCGVGLAFIFVINPILQWWTGKPGPVMAMDSLMELVLALLGLGALRTVEKRMGTSK